MSHACITIKIPVWNLPWKENKEILLKKFTANFAQK